MSDRRDSTRRPMPTSATAVVRLFVVRASREAYRTACSRAASQCFETLVTFLLPVVMNNCSISFGFSLSRYSHCLAISSRLVRAVHCLAISSRLVRAVALCCSVVPLTSQALPTPARRVVEEPFGCSHLIRRTTIRHFHTAQTKAVDTTPTGLTNADFTPSEKSHAL